MRFIIILGHVELLIVSEENPTENWVDSASTNDKFTFFYEQSV